MKKLLSGILAAVTAVSMMQMSAFAQRYETETSAFSANFDTQAVGEAPAGMQAVQGVSRVCDLDGEMCLKVSTVATGAAASNAYILNAVAANYAPTIASDNGAIVATARYYFPKALSNNRLLRIDFHSDSRSQRSLQAFTFYNDKICAGGNTGAVVGEYPVGEWFTVKYTIMPSQDKRNDSYGRMELICGDSTSILYDMPLSQLGAGALFPNTAISVWQHNLEVKGTQTGVAEDDEVVYYIDDLSLERVQQTTMIDADFDDGYYHAGSTPTLLSFKNDQSGLNITIDDMGDEHGNVMKCTGIAGAFRNINNMSESVCRNLGNAWIFEHDLYCAQPVPAGKSIFPMFYTGTATNQPGAFAFLPYCIAGSTINMNLGGTPLAEYPVGEWFKLRLIYSYADHSANDTVILQMIKEDGTVIELYRKTKTELNGLLTYNGTQFPVNGVGQMVMTVNDNTAGNTYYFDNFKMYSFDLPTVENLRVDGIKKAGSTITADYSFKADDGGKDISEIVWYRGSRVADGANTERTEIASGTKEYTLTEEDSGRYITCEVMPISSKGTRAYAPVKAEVTVSDIVFDFEDAAQAASIKQTHNTAIVSIADINGRNALAIVPDNGGTAIQNQNLFGGISDGTIIISTDIYLPDEMADDASALMQYFASTQSVAGQYVNAYWIKNNKLYATDGTTELCPLPRDEWFTVKSVISAADRQHLMVTLLERENGDVSVVDRRTVTISNLKDAGIMMMRMSYSVPGGSGNTLYLDNLSVQNELASGVYNETVTQNGTDVEYSADIVDYTYQKGVMILKDNDTTDFNVGIVKLNPVQAEESVNAVISGGSLGEGFRRFIWNSIDDMDPVIK